MLGTLNGALAVRGIQLEGDDIHASATGTNELKDGIITLTRIDVNYTLRVPAGARETVERALAKHRDKCPTAQSLRGSVAVEWTADITET
jgi:organic hydroperoxide reductase OsmC/OhrA